MCSLNDNLLSRVSPRCFWFELSLTSELSEMSGIYVVAFFFQEKIISCACLVWFGSNDIFHWYAPSCIFNRSLLTVEAEMFTHLTVLNKEVSSAKNLTSEFSPCGRSFIEMRKSIGPNTDPCGTPALIDSQPEDWPFKMTLWRLLWKNNSINWTAFLFILLFLSFYKNLCVRLCQINTFDKSRKIPCTSREALASKAR